MKITIRQEARERERERQTFFDFIKQYKPIFVDTEDTRVYPKVSGLAAWSENCKWYSCLQLGGFLSLFCESV
jgi:hypothetical protein